MIEWMAQAAPLREASTVKKMNDRSLLFCLNKITYYFKKWATGNSPERHVYASRLSKAKGFCTEPQKGVFSLYFDSFSPPNAKRSKIKTFLKVSLVSLTFRLRTVFYFFEKMTVISLCWFTMKKWDLCKCFCAFNNFSNKNYCNLFCGINSHL